MDNREVWILGGTGRIGRAVAKILDSTSAAQIVLVGRSQERLDAVRSALSRPAGTELADSPGAIAELVRARRPAVVVNALGSYADSADSIARACMPGGHYVDLANDLASMPAIVALNDEAIAANSTLVTGAGFGVVGTEAVVAKLCAGRGQPTSVRIDALGSVGTEAGVTGAAFAASIVEVLATGGRQYRDRRLVAARLGAPVIRVTTPDGYAVSSAGTPSGELLAARLVSGAPDVVATSALAPVSPAARAILPVAGAFMKIGALRRFATRRLAAVRMNARPRPRPYSWGHAVAQWPEGVTREGWLRAGDAMDFTANVAAIVAARLIDDLAPTGAFTPTAAFGPNIAEVAGGEFVGEFVRG